MRARPASLFASPTQPRYLGDIGLARGFFGIVFAGSPEAPMAVSLASFLQQHNLTLVQP